MLAQICDLLLQGGFKARELDRCGDAHEFFSACLKLSIDSCDGSSGINIKAIEALAINAFDYWPPDNGDALQKSHELCRNALSSYRKAGDDPGVARTLRLLARHEPENANALLKESLEICERVDDRRGSAETLMIMGKMSGDVGNQSQLLGKSLDEARRLGDGEVIAQAIQSLGLLQESDPDTANGLFDEAIALRRTLEPNAALVRLLLISTVCAFRSDVEKRHSLLLEALNVSCEIGSFGLARLCLDQLTKVACDK